MNYGFLPPLRTVRNISCLKGSLLSLTCIYFYCLKSSGSGEHRQSGYFNSENWQGVRSQSFELVFFFSLCFKMLYQYKQHSDVCNIIQNLKKERISVCGYVPEKFADTYGYFSSSAFSSGDSTQPSDLSFHGLELIPNHQCVIMLLVRLYLSLFQHSHLACPRPYSTSFLKRLLFMKTFPLL